MLISNQHKFIFVHIQKTGGSSVKSILRDVDPTASRNVSRLLGFSKLDKPHSHASIIRTYIGPRKWNQYYKFAFVRNPWGRAVSWYHMCLQRPTNKFMFYVKNNTESFSDFVELMDSGIAKKTTVPQLDYVADATGKIIVDFIGRYENIQEDFNHICQKLNLPSDVELPYKNKSKHNSYHSYYNEKTKALIAERFARDIEYFGYEF